MVCYFYRSVFVWFSSGRKLHSAATGEFVLFLLVCSCIKLVFFLNYNNQLFSFCLICTLRNRWIVCLFCSRVSVFTPGLGWLLWYLRSASIVWRKVCPLCYKHVIAMSPRRILKGLIFTCIFKVFANLRKLWKYKWKLILNSTRTHAITYTNYQQKVKITNKNIYWQLSTISNTKLLIIVNIL